MYDTWVRLFELQKYYSWIVDRFHISTRMYQLMNHAHDYDFHWLEQRLLPFGFQIVFLNRTPESFVSAREECLKVSGKPSQYNDLNRFIEEQELFKRLVAESSLLRLELDISDNDISRAVESIADWMEQTGVLYMN